MMARYLFNAPIAPVNWSKYKKASFELERIPEEVFCQAVKESAKSSIGHGPTAEAIAKLCNTSPPPIAREEVYMEPGDEGYHLVLKRRAPPNRELSYEEMRQIGWWLVRSRRVV
jgi:hypothetical protein